ncbi:MAG: nitroreductase family protein [Methanospirillaceae archaeon]|nr:nitroreductase family protein [Methanospirillaceae archaeon]
MNIGTTIIKSRRSVRAYTEVPIDEEIIKNALDCARLAPTAMNLQPWIFVVVQDTTRLREIAEMTDHGKFIADAQLCIAVFGEKDAKYYLEDCCAATQNIIIALQAYGVSSCWVAGDKKAYADDISELLQVPEKYTLVSLLPAGYPKEVTVPHKKILDDVVFYEEYSEKP